MKEHRVYFLRRGDGLIKIGTTTDFDARLRALVVSHGPLEIIRVLNGGRRVEQALHHRFRALRQFGEWFRDDGSMSAEIDRLEEGPVVGVSVADDRKAWEEAEAATAKLAAEKASKLIAYWRIRNDGTREQALAAVSRQYGIPLSFLTHIYKGKASSVSAHGLAALNAAVAAEARASLASVEAEMRAIGSTGADAPKEGVGE